MNNLPNHVQDQPAYPGEVEVLARDAGRVYLRVHELSVFQRNVVLLVLPVYVAQAAARSLRLAARLAEQPTPPAGCPVWCEPSNHLPSWPPHAAALGEHAVEPGGRLIIALHQGPDRTPLVSLYASRRNGVDAMVELDTRDASRVARRLFAMASDAVMLASQPAAGVR